LSGDKSEKKTGLFNEQTIYKKKKWIFKFGSSFIFGVSEPDSFLFV